MLHKNLQSCKERKGKRHRQRSCIREDKKRSSTRFANLVQSVRKSKKVNFVCMLVLQCRERAQLVQTVPVRITGL